MKSEIEKIQEVCTEAGVQFIDTDGQFVFFQDIITKERLSITREKFTSPKIQAVVTVHRRRYPKHVEMHSDFADAINFLAKKYYNVPPRAIADAALAATLVIQNYLNQETLPQSIDEEQQEEHA
ncbi:MAG: hypothetical protein HYV29_01680 [Ignavibacteriales bacterium]|nr:hypothetical protein [Ignavibacteriales bacterium]